MRLTLCIHLLNVLSMPNNKNCYCALSVLNSQSVDIVHCPVKLNRVDIVHCSVKLKDQLEYTAPEILFTCPTLTLTLLVH